MADDADAIDAQERRAPLAAVIVALQQILQHLLRFAALCG